MFTMYRKPPNWQLTLPWVLLGSYWLKDSLEWKLRSFIWKNQYIWFLFYRNWKVFKSAQIITLQGRVWEHLLAGELQQKALGKFFGTWWTHIHLPKSMMWFRQVVIGSHRTESSDSGPKKWAVLLLVHITV